MSISAVGVVVPAHDEAELLGDCLDALLVAVESCPVPADLVVVLDSCRDGSAAVCESRGVRTMSVGARNVGIARAVGVASLVSGWDMPQRLWLAGTDADTVVPSDWLARQVELADAGADAVLGTVVLDPRAGLAGDMRQQFDELYGLGVAAASGAHAHVHGANLGVRASSYLAAGGYPPVRNHEDRALVRALRDLPGTAVVPSIDLRVRTSARLDGRCEEGFAAYLCGLVGFTPDPRGYCTTG